jgi:DNA polymerase-3 subunit epsilon
MNLVCAYDLETTGLPDWKNPSDSHHQPHIVQLAGILADDDTGKIISSLDLIIQPDGWEIPQEVTDIHGITNEMANQVGVNEADAVALFLQMVGGAKRLAHNRTFDQRIIRIATKRYFPENVQEQWAEKENHDCTMLMAKPIMQLEPKGRYGYKSPKLSEAYLHFMGKELEDAHSAMADARACLDIYFAMKELPVVDSDAKGE